MTTTLIDARAVPPLDRHALIFSTFDALTPGQAFEGSMPFRVEREGFS